MWMIPVYESVSSGHRCGHIEVPSEKCTFWAALKHKVSIHEKSQSYSLLISVADLDSGYPAFPTTFLHKDILEMNHPEISTTGILGEWCLMDQGTELVSKPRIHLIRECDPTTFAMILKSEHLHPPWIWPAYEKLDVTKFDKNLTTGLPS